MKLHVIISRQQIGAEIDASLERACLARDVSYQRIIIEETVVDDLRRRQFKASDLLYRVSQNHLGSSLNYKSKVIESILVAYNPDITSTYLYRRMFPQQALGNLTEQFASDLPIIPSTIIDPIWTEMSEQELSARVQKLGGFPVIIKTLGLSRGRGVALVQDVLGLRESIQEIMKTDANAMLRKYLTDYRHYRLIVVDGDIVAANEYHKPDDDFRTNAGTSIVTTPIRVDDLSEVIKSAAISAVSFRSSIFGGVDILVDTAQNVAYLAEVNIPCYFPRTEEATGIDIAGHIVDALIKNSNKSDDHEILD
ncbi:MAG: hypothetical protein WAW63_04285 [Candidatus Saccharimonadales bacterium]|nr:hypothetical protein [Candidatus Saccharibacteria bacterium]